MLPLVVTKTDVRLVRDPARVITKSFVPGGDESAGRPRAAGIVARILAMSDTQVETLLSAVQEQFESRHADLSGVFEANFTVVARWVERVEDLTPKRRLLIGSYFTHEYSIEAAALTNPSIVSHPDQSGLASGQERFILSLRAIGEGHVSSIQFRSGVIDERGRVAMDPLGPYVSTAARHAPIYDKAIFRRKLAEIHAYGKVAASILDSLPEHFTMKELEVVLRHVEHAGRSDPSVEQTTRTIHWLASSNYESSFPADSPVSQRIVFPAGPTESHGMEDARFVRFTDDHGTPTYFGTYTAYDGYRILPQLIETSDFISFRMATLNGPCARNKGMALFPRKVAGHFAALARLDNENSYLMLSDNIHFWDEAKKIQIPERGWELVQIGNCGSPLETEAGWLVITHGVGPMRQYALGAILLDRDDPARIIGHLPEPLLAPAGDEREGYVPNVVYSCGAMISGSTLVLPYGYSDAGARIATVPLPDLLAKLTTFGAPH